MGGRWREGEVLYYITGYTNSITQLALKHKEMIRVIEVSILQGMGGRWRERKWCIYRLH